MATDSFTPEGMPHPVHGNGLPVHTEKTPLPGKKLPDYYGFLKLPVTASEQEIAAAILEKRKRLKSYQKEDLPEETRTQVQRTLQFLDNADATLLDPNRRSDHDIEWAARHDAMHTERVGNGSSDTHDVLADIVPQAVTRRHQKKPGFLASLGEKWKQHRGIGMAAAGVVGAAAALFSFSKPQETQTEQAQAPEARTLPKDAPELATRSGPVPKSTESVAAETAAPAGDPPPPKPEIATPTPMPAPKAETTPNLASPPTAAPVHAQEEKKPAIVAEITPALVEQRTSGSAGSKTAAQRSPAPTREDMEQYADLEEKSPTLAHKSTTDLIKEARQSANRTVQWVWLRIAFRKACATNDLDGAMRVLETRQELFDEDIAVRRAKAQAVWEVAGNPNADAAVVMRHAYHVTDQLCDEDQALARSFLAQLQKRPAINRQQVVAMTQYVQKLGTAHRRLAIDKQRATLDEHPDDPQANRAVGEYECFERGHWSQVGHLQKSGDRTLQELAGRVEGLDTLSAEALCGLAKDMAGRKPTRPGALALAVECCDLGKGKTKDPALTTRFDDLRLVIIREHKAILPLVQHPRATDMEMSQSIPTLPDTVSLPGAVSLLSGTPEELLKRSSIVRPEWRITMQDGKPVLTSVSGHHTWISFIHVPLSPESLALVRSGHPYVFTAMFSRTSNGRTPRESPGNAQQGGSAFLVPLPNGRHICVIWDSNTDARWHEKGRYRSGVVSTKAGFFTSESSRPTTWHFDHARPIVQEDGRQYVCRVIVASKGNQIRVDGTLIEHGKETTIASTSFVAPMDVDSAPYYLREGTGQPPKVPVVGFGGGGGTMRINDVTLAPAPPLSASRQ